MAGGILFFILTSLILLLAANEYLNLFQAGDYLPSRKLVLASVFSILLVRQIFAFDWDHMLLPLFIMLSMGAHLYAYEQGRDKAGSDFAITLSAIFYIGILGAFMVSLRYLPQGQWWLMLTLFSVWVADSAAFFIGRRYGKNKLAPRLSPNKSWQGYLAGIFFAVLTAPLFLRLFENFGLAAEGDSSFAMLNVLSLAFFMALLPTLGDLGVSMIKRQMAIKDSGTILPGHGGMLDRMDSWLWAFPISYFLIAQFFLR